MEIFILYFIVAGVIYASWLWDEEEYRFNWINVPFGLIYGWIIVPILIGRVIKQIYKD